MTPSSGQRGRRIAVVGGGLAGFTAAQTLRARGVDVVMIHPKSPGASALWGGLGQAFGPSSDFLPFSTGLVGAPLPAGASNVTVARQERYSRLEKRRAFHPYVRLGLSRAQVRQALATAVDDLGYPGLRLVDEELVFPSALASPYPADLAASSVVSSAIARGDRVGVVCCAALADWHPHRLVDALVDAQVDAMGDADDVGALAIDVAPLSDLPGTSQHSVAVAARLENALDGDPAVLVDNLEAAVEDHALDLVILPPCLGRTWSEHQALFERLTAGLSCRVAEAAASRNSIHGWRLDRFLRALPDIEVVSSRAISATSAGQASAPGRRLRRLQTENGPVDADAFIIATGRWIGGGLPSKAPLREPILGVDLWLDGAPIANAGEAWPPNLLDRHVWDDHPLFRAGLATDDRLRPLDAGGTAVADNVFAAGRVLSGFHPFLDGTTEGVDLVTGHIAAHEALAFFEDLEALETGDTASQDREVAP